ncbi:MAG: DUF1361 domain-containing protein [Actinomycetota bacterium]|nr:DUF1361 domain-containing protein [Actinomycetota bacterium]
MLERLRGSSSDRRLTTLAALLALTLFATATIGVRVAYTGSVLHVGIAWNLALAWIPVLLALAVYDHARTESGRAPLVVLSALWLLFFPNAPYIVTDLKHLHDGGAVPLWYDLVLLSSAAWAGLILGFLSLYLMQAVVRRFAGAVNAWVFVVGVLALSSFGIYLGRFRRWNSWDVFVRPRSLFGDIWSGVTDPFAHPRPVAVTILFTGFLAASYLVFYAFARVGLLERDSR